MNDHDQLTKFLDAATAGLSDDRELQLDVRAELQSHVEAALDARSEDDAPQEQPVTDVLKEMGDAPELAGLLADANRTRMKWRARGRFALRYLLVPVALLVALFSTDLGFIVAPALLGQLNGTSVSPWSTGPQGSALVRFLTGRRELTDDERLVMEGEPRAIWDAAPENVTYLNNYLTHLVSQISPTVDDKLMAKLSEVCEAGNWLDPDNARYDYAMAAALLSRSCTLEEREEKGANDAPYRVVIKDRDEFEQGLTLLKRGAAKPVLRRRHPDMLRERLDILGDPVSLLEQIRQIGLAASVLLPDLTHYRSFARIIDSHARAELSAGRKAGAEELLDCWEPLCRHLLSDSFTLIDILVVSAIAKVGEESVIPMYAEAGNDAKSIRATDFVRAVSFPVEKWRERRDAINTVDGNGLDLAVRRSGSILVAMLLPAVGEEIDVADFGPGRWLEHLVAETTVVCLLTTLFLFLMLAYFLIALRWRLTRRQDLAPILFTPSFGDLGKSIGVGVLLPLAAFFVLTRWTLFGWRHVNLSYGGICFALQFAGLVIVLVYLTRAMAVRRSLRRCTELGISVPAGRSRDRLVLASAVVALLAAMLPPEFLKNDAPAIVVAASGAVWLFVVLLFVPAVRTVRAVVARPELGLYHGSVARSMISAYALALIVLNLTAVPYLKRAEAFYIQADTLIGCGNDGSPGFTKVETRLVERLRSEMTTAAESVGQE